MSKKLLLIFMLIFLLCGCTAKQDFKDGYAIVYKENTPFLLNKNNELFDLSEYDSLPDTFSELLTVGKYVNQVLEYGYINNSGDLVIKIQYDNAYKFSEGLAVVVKNNVYSIINEDNEVVYTLPEGYTSSSSFKNGFLKIEKDGKSTFINKKFEICDKLFDSVENFSSGYALVINNENNVLSYNFLNEKYELIFTDELKDYDFVDSFYDNYARVGRYINDEYYYSFISPEGTLLKDEAGYENFLIAENFSNNHALVYNGDYFRPIGRKYRYSPRFINTNGLYYNYDDFYISTIAVSHESDNCGKEILTDFYFNSQTRNFVSDYLVVKFNTGGAGYSSLYKINTYDNDGNPFTDLENLKLVYESDELTPFEKDQYRYPYDMKLPTFSEFYEKGKTTILIAVRIYTDKYALVDGNGNYLFEAIYDNIIL